MPEIVVDGRACRVPDGTTILEAARGAGAWVPALCRPPWLERACDCACGVCVVEVEGKGELVTACDHAVEPGMAIRTDSAVAAERRREAVSFLLAQHPRECLVCERGAHCELRKLADALGVRTNRLTVKRPRLAVDRTGRAIVRDPNKCVMCGRCVSACMNMHAMSPYGAMAAEICKARDAVELAGPQAILGDDWARCRSLAFEDKVRAGECVECGQCAAACPTGALVERSELVRVRRVLADRTKVVVAQTAPALRTTFAEAWGRPAGTVSTGLMVAALRRLGFDKVFDTALGADLTAVEEAHELRERIEARGKLPMFTSCCPAWVRFAESTYHELACHLSTCKSPHMMLGAVAKAVVHETEGVALEDMHVVSLMPCTAKKFEAARSHGLCVRVPCARGKVPSPEDYRDGRGTREPSAARSPLRDVDSVLTTRELIRLIQGVEMDVGSLEESGFDDPLGSASGGGTIFGASGGVMEASLRALADETGADLVVRAGPDREGEAASGYRASGGAASSRAEGGGLYAHCSTSGVPGPGVADAVVVLGDLELRVAVIQGLAAARRILDDVAAGKRPYDFVEVMACPGGCVGGGGQPILGERDDEGLDRLRLRGAALRAIDETNVERSPRRNPAVTRLYDLFLGEPGGARAKELLHDPTRLSGDAGGVDGAGDALAPDDEASGARRQGSGAASGSARGGET